MMKRTVPLHCVLVLAVLACSGDGEATTTPADNTPTSAAEVATTVAEVTVATPPTGGTLARVQSRGALRCGVGDSAIGFAEPQEDGSYIGLTPISAVR